MLFLIRVSEQTCYPCGPLNYIVDPHSGGSCLECPKGMSGSQPINTLFSTTCLLRKATLHAGMADRDSMLMACRPV